MTQEERSRFPVAFLAGAGVVGLLLVSLFLVMRHLQPPGPIAERPLPMGESEQAYAQNIHFLDVKMSRATNFLNQEFTYVFGIVSNDGPRTLREMEVTMEFRDFMNQVVLREARRLFGPRDTPLGSGQRREFQFAFDHIPADWNRQPPRFRVTGLVPE